MFQAKSRGKLGQYLLIITIAFLTLCSTHSCEKRYYSSSVESKNAEETNYPKNSEDRHTSNYNTIEGKVIRISDGDTFELMFENGFKTKIRLNGIDCPEKKQPFSKKAKETLSDLIFNKMVLVEYKSKDRYGRILGTVLVNNLNVNKEMLSLGMAWHYKRYSDDEILSNLEKDARSNRIGLWQESNPIAPWDFRSKKK